MDLVRPRSTSAAQGGTVSSYSSQSYQDSPTTSRPTTSHGPGYRTKDRLRQFHRLSAYQSYPEMSPHTVSEVQTNQPLSLPTERRNPSPEQHEKTETPPQMKRRKSTTVKSSFRKLFGRSSPASADEGPKVEDVNNFNHETRSGSTSQSQRSGSLQPTPTEHTRLPNQYTQSTVNPLGKSVSAPHSSRQSYDDADYTSQTEYARRKNRLQRPRTARGLGPQLTIDENKSSQPGRAIPTLPVIVSPVDTTPSNAYHDFQTSNKRPTPPSSPPTQRKPTSRRQVKDSLDNTRGRYGGNQDELSDIARESRPSRDERWQTPAGEVALTPQQVTNVDPWSHQTAPRQVMEATSLAARIAELEKRLAEVEYSVHKLTRALYERSPNRPGENGSRDSGPYLTPPSSQHENVSADAVRPSTSSRTSSKKSKPSTSPTSFEDLKDVDQETTPRATFLASPSMDEFGQVYISPERTQRPLHRTASAEDLNARHIQAPLNALTYSTSALHKDLKNLRTTLSSPTVHVLDPFYSRPETDTASPHSSSQPLLPTPTASPTTPHYLPQVRSPSRDESASYTPRQPTFPSMPGSRWSAYETDTDSTDDYASPRDQDDDRAADADAEDNNITPFSTALSTERSSLEEARSSPAYLRPSTRGSRGPPPPVSTPSISSSSRPSTAGAVESTSTTSAMGKLRARSAVDRVLAASERRRNEELKAFFDAGPPRGRGGV